MTGSFNRPMNRWPDDPITRSFNRSTPRARHSSLLYSYRSATIGSTLVARRAGK